MKNTFVIVLAAGKGTRMKSLLEDKSKVSYEILGVPLVKYVLKAADQTNPTRKVVVVGFGGETTKKICENDAEIVWQREQKGTGHAVLQALPLLENLDGNTLIVCGDTPLLTGETLSNLIKEHEEQKNALTVLSAVVPNAFGYGRIVRNNEGGIESIVEQKNADEETAKINEVNTGVCVYDNKLLFEHLKELKPNGLTGEYYLTDLIHLFVKEGLKVGVSIMKDYKEMSGINDRVQLAEASNLLKLEINKKHMLNGVTIIDPNNTYISEETIIEPDTVIYPGTIIMGKTHIGKSNEIGPNTYLKDMEIGDNNEIIYSHLVDSKIGNNNNIGPYTRMRGHVVVEDGCKAGNFVEFKGITFKNGAKCAHLTYLGDAEIGERVNVGCGTIIANYDGKNKFKSKIGNDVFVGSGTTIISPVTVEDNAFIAAGSTINRDIKENEMAIARARQENKPEYAKKLREKALKIYKENHPDK